MERWQGVCRSCGQSGPGAVTLVYRGQALGGLCPACARDPARLRAFVAVAEAFRRGLGSDGSRGTVRLHRPAGLREAVPQVLFAHLVPPDLRVPGQGRSLPPAISHAQMRSEAAARDLPGAADLIPTPRQGLWRRLRHALCRG